MLFRSETKKALKRGPSVASQLGSIKEKRIDLSLKLNVLGSWFYADTSQKQCLLSSSILRRICKGLFNVHIYRFWLVTFKESYIQSALSSKTIKPVQTSCLSGMNRGHWNLPDALQQHNTVSSVVVLICRYASTCNPIVIKLEILRLVRLVTFFNRPTPIF